MTNILPHQTLLTTKRQLLEQAEVNELLPQVFEQIKSDVYVEDFTSITELLAYVPTEALIAFLSEINNDD